MKPEEVALEVDQLAQQASRMMQQDPVAALGIFTEAHGKALALGRPDYVATLSILIARAWRLRQSLVQPIRFARRAVAEAPELPGGHYTLGHFYDQAASRDEVNKPRRALILFTAAQRAYTTATSLRGPDVKNEAGLAEQMAAHVRSLTLLLERKA